MVRNLLALDLGSPTPALTRAAARVSAQFGSEIVIAHALEPLTGRDYPSAESECLSAAQRIQEQGGRVSETLIIRVSPAEDLILTSARELDASLVVMGWGMAQRLGSTTRGVLRAAPCSLFLVGEGFLVNEEDAAPQDLEADPGIARLSIQDLPPLARLAALTRVLAASPPPAALLAEVEHHHSPATLSRGVAS